MDIEAVAPFPMIEFRAKTEFDDYMRRSATLRGDRWLYEQSLATQDDAVTIHGTCGICLTEACFTAATRDGELVAAGRVPNWREELTCDCRQRLSNRQRALLHYLLASGLLHPWTRVLGVGDLGALIPLLKSRSHTLTCWSGAVDLLPKDDSNLAHAHHLVIAIEEIDAGWIQRESLATLAAQLADGGRLVFTTPFDVAEEGDPRHSDAAPIGWSILPRLREQGFSDAKACLYWSEEFGYLGPLNFIFDASK